MYFQGQASKLQKELQATKAHETEMEGSIAVQHELLRVDSLLVDGNYNAALDSYKEKFQELQTEDKAGVEMRMALAEEFLKLRRAQLAATLRNAELAGEDSINLEIVATPREIRQYDSLSFVLEKTKAQLVRIKRQVQQKSSGEYLTFESSKGSQMHYVGQVRNHKANGHGIALLSTGSRYEGEWKDNMRHGEGTFFWADGQYYIGSYVKDKREGSGTYYWPNGEKYVGQWKNDQRYGEGVFFGKDGKVIADGVWEEDKLVAVADK